MHRHRPTLCCVVSRHLGGGWGGGGVAGGGGAVLLLLRVLGSARVGGFTFQWSSLVICSGNSHQCNGQECERFWLPRRHVLVFAHRRRRWDGGGGCGWNNKKGEARHRTVHSSLLLSVSLLAVITGAPGMYQPP